MTETGQVPGEGLPEDAGAVGPGVPAPGAYAYADPAEAVVTEDDELLLMPGSQGAWGQPQSAPYAAAPHQQQAPAVVHEPGPHEMAGRDSGHHDLGAMQMPQATTPGPQTQGGQRRPLHLGPQVPEPGAGPVRSLADRGPAQATPTPPQAMPLHQAVPAAAGPEYLDVPPQGAAPWQPAETVVPEPAPGQSGQFAHPQAPAAGQEFQPVPEQQPMPAYAGAPEQPLGQFVPVEGTVPTTPHLAPTPPQAMVVPPLPEPDVAQPQPQAVEGLPAEQPVVEQPLPEQQVPVNQASANQVPVNPVVAPVAPEVPAQDLQVPGEQIAEPQPVVPQAPVHQDAAQQPAPEQQAPEQQAPEQQIPAQQVSEQAPVVAEPAQAVVDEAPAQDAAAQQVAAAPVVEDQVQDPEPVAGDQAQAQDPAAHAVADQPQAEAPAQTPAAPAVEDPAQAVAVAPVEGQVQDPAQEQAPVEEQAPAEDVIQVAAAPAQAPAAEQPQAHTPAEGVALPVADPAEADAQAPAEEPQGPQLQEAAEPEAMAPAAQDAQPQDAEPQPGTTPAGTPDAVAAVPAPRDGTETAPAAVQSGDELPTAEAEPEPETPLDPTLAGPAAPGYDDAEREAVLRVMRERRDIRNGFRSDPIPHEVLLRVLEAAHTAPSVGHSQPWDFVVIRSADTRRAMHELAERQRDAYAKSLPKGRAKQFKELKIEAILDTPVNIVVTADPTRGGRHTLGRHTQPQMAPYSSALAVENLWLAARAEGLGVGWVSFFDEREMVRALGLPEHLEVVAYLCVGYVDEFPDEPELMQAGWSKRRPLSWVVHEETYGRRALPGEDPHDLLAETVANIRPLDAKALGEAWERQKRMTKPAGALGMLEIISAQLSGLSRMCPPPIPEPAAVAIFAGDHGVHAQGVTPWPQEVTGQMVANFLGGGAVCNAFASQVGAEVCVIDVGVASELPATPGLLPRKVRAGTADMTTGPALTREEVKAAIEVGIETARDLVAAGNKALLTGEMGIANTTASAALISVYTETDPAEVTGRGTGINDETHARKVEVVRRALELHQPDPADPIGVLAAVGGLEHAALVGLLLGGASLRTPVVLDGVSAGAAALVARAIAPEVLAACIAGHRSAEPGHVAALNKLGLRPLVDLDLRLGEGTGALLALPIIQSAARAMHEVATFDSAGVTEK
jgi:nicotinate-nucleotide--dimethylbenzimidazole phosphoribosyltransferase